nr:MAG TPA: hypothetical protein [Caudoviricetes sp.]
MTTKAIVDECNTISCVDCKNEEFCIAYTRKYGYSPSMKDNSEIRAKAKLPDSAYSESEVIEI